jgi:hypothetical protein
MFLVLRILIKSKIFSALNIVPINLTFRKLNSMEQHIFAFSLIIEGTTEKVLQIHNAV